MRESSELWERTLAQDIVGTWQFWPERPALQVRALECVQGYQNKKKAIMASRPGGVEEFDPPVKTMNKASEYTGSLAPADQDHNVRHSRP